MKRRMLGLAALTAVLGLGLLTSCATRPADPQPAAPGAAPATAPATAPLPSAAITAGLRVSGTLSYLQRVALPPDSEVIVQLRDVSRMDGAAGVMAEQRFTARSQVPLDFELLVEPGKINSSKRYAVSARIVRAGRLLFINDKLHLVLTRGHGSRVDMLLYMVSSP